MSDVNKGDEDPGASTVMFQRFVDDGQAAPSGRAAQGRSRRGLVVAVAGVVLVAAVVVLFVLFGR